MCRHNQVRDHFGQGMRVKVTRRCQRTSEPLRGLERIRAVQHPMAERRQQVVIGGAPAACERRVRRSSHQAALLEPAHTATQQTVGAERLGESLAKFDELSSGEETPGEASQQFKIPGGAPNSKDPSEQNGTYPG
ncbi:MAG: hypothetical protein NTY19_07860 [Planctomycetota bacterium]|nr:hypothetical protein [Planctomycetota bacterium]